ncbi:hypothetical protein [uncultured Leifsonia sp.]|uniref:hypothetical protein n=1 Tax=Leifsonia sp. TaxID=1870902 RepID=UPI0028D77B6D|nr:hypothetical protein [uncultured Leifsonia sp.]
MGELLLRGSAWLAATPSPTPTGGPNADDVTPGVVGFVVTFLLAVVVVLLVIDMVRRIRRVRYRAEIAEKLDAEQAAAAGRTDGDAGRPRDDRPSDDDAARG